MADKPASVVNCPTCDKPVDWTEKNKWRPFCSERCKLIDLGEWASESYKVNGEGEGDFRVTRDED